jgi:type IV pilus assembly protein PilQ
MHKPILLAVVLFTLLTKAFAQDSTQTFQQVLNQKVIEIPKLNEKVNISVGNVAIQEFLRGVANNSGVNIDVDPALQINVTNNFSDVRVADILLFLHNQFNLQIDFIGNIITIKGNSGTAVQSKTNRVIYDYETDLVTIDYDNEAINAAIREITRVTGYNIILSPGLDTQRIQGYIQNMPFENAIEKLAFTNGLLAEKTNDGIFIIKSAAKKGDGQEQVSISNYNRGKQVNVESFRRSGIQISTERADSICIYATLAKKLDLIEIIARQLGINYFIASELKGEISLNVTGITFEEFLNYVLSGSDYTYKNLNGVYIVGGKSINELNDYMIVQLRHRTVDSLLHILPKEMVENIEIKEFVELNSVFLAGASNKIREVSEFIKLIDKPVPVILIEIIVVDVTKSHTISTGIQAGLGDAPATSQQILPGIDYTMSSQAINSLINKFDGFGWVNLGNVSEDFYISLKALENNGFLEIKSTPKLSTLNGHKANLKIGETKYYKEEKSQLYGTQNPSLSNSFEYKSVDADLDITIRPVVSGDNQITLTISVKQSDFDLTSSLGEGAPPNKKNKEFKSTIRIKNEEVIILGGLEQNQIVDSGNGIPFLSRIPILKWIFSSKTKSNSKAKLNIFIKPTIIG